MSELYVFGEFDMRETAVLLLLLLSGASSPPVVQDKMAAVHTDVHAMSYYMSV